jgi:uncharacterized membrane protein/predicted DsbA family dithiol-disulfide isomerase
LSLLGLALSVYLSWLHLAGGSAIGCGGGSGCEQVLNSRWSTIAGVLPVSGLAVGAYLAMLAASLAVGPATAAPVRRLAWGAMLVLVGAAAGSAVWFTILQKWAIGAFCPYCTATHITGLLLAILIIRQAPRQLSEEEKGTFYFFGRGQKRGQKSRMSPFFTLGPALVGLVLAGGLAACQVVIAPPPVYLAGQSQESLPAVDACAGPMVGSPNAPHVVTLLFDYTCPHCQRMHFMLNEVIRRYGGRLAFALRPAPLDSECNPHITRDVKQFKGSCEAVKIGLAVWVARREVFGAFEDWMFSFESGDRWRPRKLDAARAKAVELVGQAKFDAARADPWIDRYLQSSIQIYGRTIQGGKGGVPKLVFGSRWVIPQPYSADDLVSILQNSLAVPVP